MTPEQFTQLLEAIRAVQHQVAWTGIFIMIAMSFIHLALRK